MTQIWPSIASGLEDRALQAEFWRPLTSHLTHRGWLHFASGTLFFLPLIMYRERCVGSHRAMLEFVTLGACVAVGIRWHDAHWNSYRGFSGVIYGFIAIVGLQLMRTQPRLARGAAILLIGISIKTLLEALSGGWLHGSTELGRAMSLRYLPGSHLGGLIGGFSLAVLSRQAARHSLARHGDRRDASQIARPSNAAAGQRSTTEISSRAARAGSDASRIAPMTATP